MLAALAAPSVGHAQTFTVEKFDIKGEGGTDYVAVEAATGRVFVSRADHMMVVDGATGKVLGDIPNTPGVHGAGIATKSGHGFTTNGGDSTVTMFDLKTFAAIKQIKVNQGGLDGIMYDEPDDKIILPGVVSHATNVVEHPELVAQRILRFANLVGRERVIASTDCGLGGRIHPDIAFAKLEALAQGAALATKQLRAK